MYARLRLVKGANLLLYLGPLLAGMSALGWGIVAPFVAIFVLWLMILRPEQWPATNAEWMTPRAWGAVLTQVVSQVLLVTVLLGIGRGISGLADFLPALNPILPLAISFMAIPVSRKVWDSRRSAELGVFLDEDAAAAQVPHAVSEAAGAVEKLLRLAEATDPATFREMIDTVMTGPAATHRLQAISAALAGSDRSYTTLRRALVIWATEPEIVAPGQVGDAVATAFVLTNRNPDLLRLFLPRALALAAAFPDRIAGFPTSATLRQAAASDLEISRDTDLPADLRADLRDGLAALARAVDKAPLPARPVRDVARREPLAEGASLPA